MKVIYCPTGAAAEYGELAVSLDRYCPHGCLYCYVPGMFRMPPEEFHQDAKLRHKILENLDKDAATLQTMQDQREIVMSFTCDPYHPGDTRATRSALEILLSRGLRVALISKGGTRATRDLDIMAAHLDKCRYGASLTFHRPNLSREWERGAASPQDRIEMLRFAHEAGIPTWASCEPIIYASETLGILKDAAPYVDEFRIGFVNHVADIQRRVPGYQPPGCREMIPFVREVSAFLGDRGKRIMWKRSMIPFLGKAAISGVVL
jgi:DNA repair photolyase